MNCNDCGGFLPIGCTCSAFGGRAERAAFFPSPLDQLLPCDITVGGSTFGKGVKLGVFIEAARRWHRDAYPDFYTLTGEQRAQNLALLRGAPRFQNAYCSQCGKDLGPGEHGVSSCCDHGACRAVARDDQCECDRTPAEKGGA